MEVYDEAYLSRKQFWGNRINNQYFHELSEQIKNDAAKATCIKIVSGYFGKDYVIEFLKQTAIDARSACSVTLIFGYDAVAEFIHGKIQISKLKEEIVKLGYSQDRVMIKLFRDRAPLHTKLYGFLLKNRHVWYVGSANFSKAIEIDRHELMLRINGKSEALDAYVQMLWNFEQPQKLNIWGEPIGAPEFFNAGCILFKPSRYKRFTYDAFNITSEDRSKMSKQAGARTRVPHADPSLGGFGFNLLSALDIPDSDAAEERSRVQFKRYCVETVYGYWVPRKYADMIKKCTINSKNKEIENFLKIKQALMDTDVGAIKKEFNRYLKASLRYFERSKVKPSQKVDATDSFMNFIEIRKKWLNDREWIERNSTKLFLEDMPNIWGDVHAGENFISSFCESLSLELNSPGGRKNMVCEELRNRLGLSKVTDHIYIRESIENVRGSFWD